MKMKYREILVTFPPPPQKNLTQLVKEKGESIVSKLMKGKCVLWKVILVSLIFFILWRRASGHVVCLSVLVFNSN